jgi:hypothetical protein
MCCTSLRTFQTIMGTERTDVELLTLAGEQRGDIDRLVLAIDLRLREQEENITMILGALVRMGGDVWGVLGFNRREGDLGGGGGEGDVGSENDEDQVS